PLLVDLLMALAALRSGGIEGECLLIDRGCWIAFELRRRGVGFRSRLLGLGSLLLVLFNESFECSVRVDFFRLSEYPSGLAIWDLCFHGAAGSGDSVLAKGRYAEQHGARERAGKLRKTGQSLHRLIPAIPTFRR